MNRLRKFSIFNKKNKNGDISTDAISQSNNPKWILDRTFLNENYKETLFSENRIDLSNKQIEQIDEDTFKELTNLRSVILNVNYIQEIYQETFKNLYNLEDLQINVNKIRFLDKDLFKDLRSLISLSLNNNRIEFIPQSIFNNLKNLYEIDISNNEIDRICHEHFSGLTNLKYIRLNNNQIKLVEKGSFDGLENLTGVYLKNNLLKEINKDLFVGLNNLKIIDWSNNKIKHIEKETFAGLLSLVEVFLDDNLLQCIDKDTFSGVNLKVISLKNNKIRQIERDSFTAQSNLLKIILRDNQIQSIESETFKGLNNLKVINLSNNQLQIINKDIFNGLKNLKKIGLSSNQIDSIDKNLFQDLVSLEFIYMNNNNLKFIDEGIFSGLFKLVKIVLSNNQIQHVHEKTFKGLTNLREIALNNNQIIDIEKSTFNGLVNLRKINVSFNQLIEMDKSIFRGLDSLEEINFNDNQLNALPNGLFRDNGALLELNLSNNDISKIQIVDLSNLNEETTINLRNNIEIYDFSIIFNSLFQFFKKDKASFEMKSYSYELNQQSKEKCFFIGRQFNFENFLLSFYLNEGVFKTKFLFDENLNSFAFNLEQLKTFKFTILDFILSYRMIDESFIINFKGFVENLLKENKLSDNIEFKLKSPHTIEIICERNDLLLFETFFKYETNNYTENSTNQWLLNNKEFYLNINFIKCFKIILNNNNEKLAILLFKLLSYVIKKLDMPKFGIQRFSKYSYFKLEEYKNIIDFNEMFLKSFLIKIFEMNWLNLIKTILDLAYNSKEKRLETRFIYLSDDFLNEEIKNKHLQLNSPIHNQLLVHDNNHHRHYSNRGIQIIVDKPNLDINQSKKKNFILFA